MIRNHPDYPLYIADQETDTLTNAGVDDKYLDYLFDTLLPHVDFPAPVALDLGCNRFLSYDYFRRRFPNGDILGIDLCLDAQREAIKNNKPFMHLDAHVMDEVLLPDNYDLILAFHSLEHVLDLRLVLENCRYILKRGGYLYYAVPMPSFNLRKGHWQDIPSNAYMEDLCKDVGFKLCYGEFFNQRFRAAEEFIALVQK